MVVDSAVGAGRPVRERILRATLRLIADEGVDAVTHRAVARRAGVSLGSTTHHFSSRTDLLREAFRYYLHEAEGLVRHLIERTDRTADPVDVVLGLVREMIDPDFNFGLTRAEYELLLFACSDAALAPDVRAWEAMVVAVYAPELERAGVERPVAAAQALLNLVRGFELERLLDSRLTVADFDTRIRPVLRALARTNRPDDSVV